MSSTYGENLKLSIFGQSHGAGIGMVLDGIPAGLRVDTEALQAFLNRRAPGQNSYSTPRREADKPEFLSGLVDGFTCGAPIAAVIRNTNTRSGDYTDLADRPRPGHADYTAQIKYGGFQDIAGGGHFSGRLTAPLCIAGGMCKQWLEEMGIRIGAHITQIGLSSVQSFNYLEPELDQVGQVFPTLTAESAEEMQAVIEEARSEGDSVGGRIECAITGLPAGLGEPMFGGVESKIAQIVYGIPAVKAVGFGWSESFCIVPGSESNDAFTVEDGQIKTLTNHCGGILGGITNGMPVIFDVAFKPTPSISKPQQTISLSKQECVTLEIKGRHDPCIVPRAVPVVEAAAAIAIYDLILGNTQTSRRK
ncbi:MAG: chorismate synthase [Oscillospiraceae bacterium]|nr:chorismate synthase [Oscillospiraceae bacterium]